MLIEWLGENLIEITTFGFTFLVGLGIGAAITDAINKWNPRPRKREDEGE